MPPFFYIPFVNFEEKNDKIKTITLRLRKENISMEKHTIELKTKPWRYTNQSNLGCFNLDCFNTIDCWNYFLFYEINHIYFHHQTASSLFILIKTYYVYINIKSWRIRSPYNVAHVLFWHDSHLPIRLFRYFTNNTISSSLGAE